MTDNHNQAAASNNMRIATLNTRSGKNKDHLNVQQLLETDTDIAVITETWIKDTEYEWGLAQPVRTVGNQTMTYYYRTDQVQRKVVA